MTDSRLAGATTTYMYDATNQLFLMTYPNGDAHSYSYDTRDRVLTLNGYTQTFSPSGRKQSVTEATGRAANYGYDNIYRLLNETISADPTSANSRAGNVNLSRRRLVLCRPSFSCSFRDRKTAAGDHRETTSAVCSAVLPLLPRPTEPTWYDLDPTELNQTEL